MKLGIIKMTRKEYREGNLCVRDYKITFFGIPIYRARFTSTNNQALQQLTIAKEAQLHITGFRIKQKER